MAEIKTFLVKMESKYRCVCCNALDRECMAIDKNNGWVCPCNGILTQRPPWCPIKEVKKFPNRLHHILKKSKHFCSKILYIVFKIR
jgi:hypothetical protein